MLKNDTYVVLRREIVDSPAFHHSTQIHALIYCILTAYFADGNGIKRGQLFTTYRRFASDCGMTYDQARYAIDGLTKCGELTKKIVPHGMVLTVTRYEELQKIPKSKAVEEREKKLGIDRIPADIQAKYKFKSYQDYEDWKCCQ